MDSDRQLYDFWAELHELRQLAAYEIYQKREDKIKELQSQDGLADWLQAESEISSQFRNDVAIDYGGNNCDRPDRVGDEPDRSALIRHKVSIFINNVMKTWNTFEATTG
jgi:hypothetical protein